MKQNQTNIPDRAQWLLKTLVEKYLQDGQPVGSKILAEGVGLSPATIRNVMADLEDLGYVRSPHTSAGRIPTAQGLRFFVDSLLTVKPLDNKAVEQVKSQLHADQSIQSLVATASGLLSKITQQAALVTLPKRERLAFRHVEFLPLSD